MGISYGPAPRQTQNFALGMHLIGINGDRLTVFDVWYDVLPCEEGLTNQEALEQAQAWLNELSNEDYLFEAKDDAAASSSIARISELTALEDFKMFIYQQWPIYSGSQEGSTQEVTGATTLTPSPTPPTPPPALGQPRGRE